MKYQPSRWIRFCAAFTFACLYTAANGAVGVNLAPYAKASTSYVSGHETITALNDGFTPSNSNDKTHGAYGNWPQTGAQWVQYNWDRPVTFEKTDVYWFDDHNGVRLPIACRLLYWDGKQFVSVANPVGLGVLENRFNTTTFSAVTTTRLRLEFDSAGKSSTGILDWRVYDNGKSPKFPPVVSAGVDRAVVVTGRTYLSGHITGSAPDSSAYRPTWSKVTGPGRVQFAKANDLATSATFSAVGAYVLKLTATDGDLSGSDTLRIRVVSAPPSRALSSVPVSRYRIDSPLWNGRAKALIVNWIPHCITMIEDPAVPEGGIDNFVQAGNKLNGIDAKPHKGAVFSNAWVHNTVEAMCIALMVDPNGDADVEASKKAIRAKLDAWIPIILRAQEPDGYLQTYFTLGGQPRWTDVWAHEGYNAGYFIEAAIAHYLMTDRKDDRMLRAAIKLADCWCNNIGPKPKRAWFDGHQEIEQALVRLADLVDQTDGAGKGKKYVELSKFLLDSRRNGSEYDQSHAPVTRQYEAVGHAVRAVYTYTGMTAVATKTHDVDYLSAVNSIWDNLINRKYYITGGVGSGESSEGFGNDYSLPNNAYCESCSGCGELFFQQRMNLLYHDAKYADLYEETLYNAILSDIDMEGQNFTYTNALDTSEHRYKWHGCPCCIGNIPRTLLSLPTWMYATEPDSLYVNLFVGSTVKVGTVAGAELSVTQTTDYPWSGTVAITLNPSQAKRFTVRVRVPNHDVSELYTSSPSIRGLNSLAVNGKAVKPVIANGYAAITRTWSPGDKIEISIPMAVQRVKADQRVAADRGRVALRCGPLVYNIESVDQDVNQVLAPNSPLKLDWDANLLNGLPVIRGAFASGSPLTAIPNFARNNRGGRSLVWIRDK